MATNEINRPVIIRIPVGGDDLAVLRTTGRVL